MFVGGRCCLKVRLIVPTKQHRIRSSDMIVRISEVFVSAGDPLVGCDLIFRKFTRLRSPTSITGEDASKRKRYKGHHKKRECALQVLSRTQAYNALAYNDHDRVTDDINELPDPPTHLVHILKPAVQMSDAYPGSLGDVAVQMLSSNYLEAASLTIIFYDFFLTLGKESKRFWERPCWSSATVLFYLNRYGGLSGYIAIAFFFYRPDFLISTNRYGQYLAFRGSGSKNFSCSKFEIFIQLHVAFLHVIISSILVLRTAALYKNDRRVKYGLGFLMLLMAVNGVVQWCVHGFGVSEVNQDVVENSPLKPDCFLPFGYNQGVEFACDWALLLALDTTVFFLTIRKTLPMVRDEPSGRSTLWAALLRDGCIYFALLSVSNMANILVMLLSPPYLKTLFPIFVNTASISRLVLNLRDPSLRNSYQTPKPIAPPLAVEHRPRANSDDLERGTPRNPRAREVANAIRTFRSGQASSPSQFPD
ncbi:hypothetical protein AB1N83_004833 [Pleurotus pulmonarius]